MASSERHSRAWTFPSRERLEEIIEAAKAADPELAGVIFTMLATGQRLGELVGQEDRAEVLKGFRSLCKKHPEWGPISIHHLRLAGLVLGSLP